MPTKKSTAVQQAVTSSGAGVGGAPPLDTSDPVMAAVAIVDKKARNLEKRKNKLSTLKEQLDDGNQLDRDQQDAVSRINEVVIQLDLLKELQKQFCQLTTDYQKSRKRQQRLEKLQQKEAEREAQRRTATYTLSVQDLLNSIGEEDKENFRTGSNGAVQLTELELTQLDDLYKLFNPSREDNASYQSDVETAGESMLLLMEHSQREIAGSTYKDLHELLKKIEQSGYFECKERRGEEEEEEEDDLDSDEGAEDEYKSAEEEPNSQAPPQGVAAGEAPVEYGYNEPPAVQTLQQLPSSEEGGGGGGGGEFVPQTISAPQAPPPGVVTELIDYAPSAPSPTFPALGPLQQPADDGFSFMHESEVTNGSTTLQSQGYPSTSSHPPPPQQRTDYPAAQYATQKLQMDPSQPQRAGQTGLQSLLAHQQAGSLAVQQGSGEQGGTTDVATGQASLTSESGFAGSAAVTGEGGEGGDPSSQLFGKSLQEQTGFKQQQYRRGQPSGGGGRGGGGGGGGGGQRRTGGSQGGGGGRGGFRNNGRGGGGGGGGRGGYDGGGSYGNARGYGGGSNSGGGGGYQAKSGGRPNYRTTGGTGGGGGGGGGPRK